MSGGKGVHNLAPCSGLSPPDETVVAGSAWAIANRQIAPWCARTQDPKDAIEHPPIIYTPNAARFVRQERLDGGPFKIAEFVAHDPRLRFRSLKSRLGQRHQPTIAGRCVTNALSLLPLSVHSGHGRTCCWHDPVANDPGCVKTLRGITAPGILGSTVTRRAKKRKNLSSARHYDQIRFRFHTAKTQSVGSLRLSHMSGVGGGADMPTSLKRRA
jgi:hypothetical protein